MEQERAPRTLMEAIRYFAQPGVARDFVAQLRWPKGPFCAKCGETDPMFLASVERWKCRGCGVQFSVKQGTVMEDSPLSLDKWLCAMWLIANCKNGISSYEIHRALGVTQKSAWFMLHRIRAAMQVGSFAKPMSGTVETDETFIGGKVSKMSKGARRKIGRRTASQGKAFVSGILERKSGTIRASVIPDLKGATIKGHIRKNVRRGSKLFTDELPSYRGLDFYYRHEQVNHAIEEYVRGEVHTNGIENFWALLKRGLGGTYVNVEPFHLFRYLDEQVFRYNHRKDTDAGRFGKLLSMLAGKRLTFKALTTGMELQTC
jgi:transposase-like protein